MNSLMLLWKLLANELASRCHTSADRDCKTITARAKDEGLSFLTITLPNFGKDFEKSLDRGYADRDLFQGFSWQAGLPRFLGGFLDRVFARASGVLLEEPDFEAILAIRQLTLMFGKIDLPCSDARRDAAFRDFYECEQEVRVSDARVSSLDWEQFTRVSNTLFVHAFSDIDRKIYEGEHVPKHGPGATADKLVANQKYRQVTWPIRLEKYFPSGDFLLPNASFWEELDRVDFLEPGRELPVRVIDVPKTLKTPRIIAIEPTAMQYCQQSVLEMIREVVRRPRFESSKRDNHLRHFIGLDDQVPNQHMAKEGSLSGELATLDLSEASDRVSNQQVLALFRDFPHLREAVQDCRSRKADVPGYGVIRLAKFASMGSALTFPIEALVFLTLIFMGIERDLNTTLSPRIVKQYVGQVRVFGDDIIIPVKHVSSVISVLSHFGAKVNVGKSFWNGEFRESCGKEYFKGEDVSIVRVRQMFPTTRKDATGVNSLVELRNQLYWAGYWQTCSWLDQRIRNVIRHFPVVLDTSPVLGRQSALGFETQRIGERYHNPMVKGYRIVATPPDSPLDGSGALLKYFLKRGSDAAFDEDHLERSGRPRYVDIKPGWASAI